MLFALALAFVLEDMIKNVANVVRGIQVVGGYLAGALDAIARAISAALGAIEHGIDSLIGATWHLFANYLDRTFSQLEAYSALIAHLASIVGNEIYNVSGLRGLVHGLERAFHGIEAGVRELTKEFHGIERRVVKLENDVAKGIGSDVLPRIRTLEREVAHVEGRVIPAVESAETALANDVTALGEYVRANFLSSATDAITAAVVVALTALGLNGLRCNSLLNSLKNRGCGLWSGLEDLLGLFTDLVVFTDVCAVLTLLEDAAGIVLPPLVALLTDINLGPCEVPPTSWAALNVANGPTPPPQSLPTSSIP